MDAKDFELRLYRNLMAAERAAGPLEILPCNCPGAYGARASCHIAVKNPKHLADIVGALLASERTAIDRFGFSPDGQFLHVDIDSERGRRRAWVIGNSTPDGGDKVFAGDDARFRLIVSTFRHAGWNRRPDLAIRSLKVDCDHLVIDGIPLAGRTSTSDPDRAAFAKRQARKQAALARQAAIREFAATKGLSLAEAEKLLSPKAA